MPLVRGIARTAVIAGTATAVSNRVSRRQANRWGAQEDAQYQQQQQQQQYAPPPPPPAVSPDDKYEQLTKLAELKTAGVLSDVEFEVEKAKILQS